MIPKIINYCWFGGKPLPSFAKKCIASWKKYCPDYKIIQWDERNFDFNCNEFVKKAYKEGDWAFVSDYARLKIIYENGGIYLDTDVEILKSIDELLFNDCFLGVQQMEKLINTGLGFGAVANHALIKTMLDEYNYIKFESERKLKLSCPFLNTKALSNLGYTYSDSVNEFKNAVIYPPKYFDPIASGIDNNLFCNYTYSIHHYSASWAPISQRIKRKVAIFIGGENIIKIKRLFKL